MGTNTLPMVSAYQHPTSGELVFVKAGVSGYWPKTALGIVDDDLTADKWNEAHKINKGEAEAMFHGSMFGWDVKMAQSDNWTKDGFFIADRLDD